MKNNEISLDHLTPAAVVKELDKYIVGQADAKRSVAIALRNRWRRQNVSENLREEIYPKNILMMGPTGCGKTEIARRLARLADAPFIKVEATKYTEVGYVGKDVESMVRDLIEISINMIKSKEKELVLPRAKEMAEERVLDLLVPHSSQTAQSEALTPVETAASTREKFRTMLRNGELDEREVTIDAKEPQKGMFEVFAFPGMENMEMNLKDMIGNMMPKQSHRKKFKVKDALKYFLQEEANRLVDMDRVVPLAIEKAEKAGIIFLDEMDKIAGSHSNQSGAGVSREGVQRDLLPIVEGSTVNTKYGMVKTDHVLFIGAGSFHQAKPSDLIPELQGRFPIRVELKSLTTSDFVQILKEPENSLLKQYSALIGTENVNLVFKDDAVEAIAQLATSVNENTENIGARRLHTILERVLEDVSFNAPEIQGQTVEVSAEYVQSKVKDLARDQDLSRYIL